jgi:hypothetical protein
MATITKNRNFFKWPKLLYFKPELSKWFQTRRLLWEFPIGSYVKLSSAVAAILVGVLKCGSNQDGRQAKNRKKGG